MFSWVGYNNKVWNLLDYSSLTIQVSAVDKDKDPIDPSYKPRNSIDEWDWGV